MTVLGTGGRCLVPTQVMPRCGYGLCFCFAAAALECPCSVQTAIYDTGIWQFYPVVGMLRLCFPRFSGLNLLRRFCLRGQWLFAIESTGPCLHIALCIEADTAGTVIVAAVAFHDEVNIIHITALGKGIEYIHTNGKGLRHRFILCHFPIAVPVETCKLYPASHRLVIDGHFHKNILYGHARLNFAYGDMHLRCIGSHFCLQRGTTTQR